MQAVLREISARGKDLEIIVDDVGKFIASDYLHFFPTGRATDEELEETKQALEREGLRNLKRQDHISFIPVIRVYAPLEYTRAKVFPLPQIKDYLTENIEDDHLNRFAVKMFDFLIQDPPEIRKPYDVERLQRHVLSLPNVQEKHHGRINEIFSLLEQGWPTTRMPNQEAHAKSKSPNLKLKGPLPTAFYRGAYTAQARWDIAPKGSIVELDDSLVEDIRSQSEEGDIPRVPINGRLQFVRMRTMEEILSQTMSVYDIEKPLFNTDQEEVSWTAVVNQNFSNGHEDRTIFSLYNVDTEVKGYNIVTCENEKELTAQVAQRIKRSGSTIHVAFNIVYDSTNLREAGPFNVGIEDETPVKVVSIPFFERMGIKGYDVLDIFKWSKIQLSYLPNQKLVTVSKHLFGEGEFDKEINYDQQAQLERICKGMNPEEATVDVQEILGDRTAPEVIASYVGEDVLVLPRIIDHERFRKSLEDVCFLSQWARVDPFLLLHDSKRIKDILDRKFFLFEGTFMEAAFPRFPNFVKYEQKVKQKLKNNVVGPWKGKEVGRAEQVTKCYLPFGRILREEITDLLPIEAGELYEYIDSHRADPQRQFFLAKFEDALAEALWTNYAAYLQERDQLERTTRGLERKGYDLNREELNGFCNNLVGIFKYEKMLDKVNRAAISQKDLREHLREEDLDYLERTGLVPFRDKINLKSFKTLFEHWCRTRQKNRILWGFVGEGWQHFESKIEETRKKVEQYCLDNGLEIIHGQNRYVYVTGDTDSLELTESPLIPVDDVGSAYVTSDKIIHSKYGFYDGFVRKEHSDHNSTIYEMETIGKFLDLILDGKEQEARFGLEQDLRKLAREEVPLEELVRHTKKSGLYRAYENGGELCFYQWDGNQNSKELAFKGETYVMKRQKGEPRDFVIEPTKWKINGDSGELEIKEQNIRYLIKIEDFNPDWEIYKEKVADKVAKYLKPVLKGSTRKFLKRVLWPGSQGELF
jgi:hypothetical protein